MSEREAAHVAERLASQDWTASGELSLDGLGLHELPRLPRAVARLRTLDLSANRLTELPEQVLAMRDLQTLGLAGNRLATLPRGIGALQQLVSLDVSENRLSGLPAALADCARLAYVDVYRNQLHDLAPLGGLPVLTRLDAADNHLSAVGKLPVSLEELDLSDNRLAELPWQISELRDLRSLDLSGNRLTSATIDVLARLHLEELYLDDNDLRVPPLGLARSPTFHFSARGNPFGELPAEAIPAGRVDTAQVEHELRERISGAPEPGRLYYDAPLYSLSFEVALKTPEAARAAAKLYYKQGRFRATPAMLKLTGGETLPLSRLRRGSALQRIAAAPGPALLSFESMRGQDEAYAATAFVAQAATRLSGVEVWPIPRAGPPPASSSSSAAEPPAPPPPVGRLPQPPAPPPQPPPQPQPQEDSENPMVMWPADDEPDGEQGSRVLNAAITDAKGSVLATEMHLPPRTDHLVRIDIGPRSPESVVVNPVAIPLEQIEPSAPDGWWFHIVLSSPDVDVAADLHRIFLPLQGSGWVCACAGAEHTCTPVDRSPQLTVAFCTREPAERASLRATLYDRGNAVQSLRLTFSVGPGELPIAGEIDYTLADDAASSQALPARRLHVLTNDGPGGTHTIVINEGSRAIAVDVGETQAAAALAPVRTKLSELTLGKEGAGFPYDAGNAKPRDAFVADLGSLARLGSQLWLAVVPDGADRAFLREQLRERAAIQVSRVTRTTFPWALIYDIPRETDPAWEPCPLLAGWEQHRELLAAYPAACPFADAHGVNTLCPYGFWGFRHLIEQPPSGRAGVLRDHIAAVAPARAPTARSLALDETLAREHFQQLGAAVQGRVRLDACDALQVLRQAFADPALPLVYFYCHGRTAQIAGTSMMTPVLEIGSGDHIGASDLASWYDAGGWSADHWQATAPLVFINGCGTAALSPEDVVSLVDALAGLRVAGIIGTEIAVDQRLAGEVALRFYAQFAGAEPQPVGVALHRTRIDLLAKGNVSGLAYTPFCSLDLILKVVA